MSFNLTKNLTSRLIFNSIKLNQNTWSVRTNGLASANETKTDDDNTKDEFQISTEFVPEYEEKIENEKLYKEFIEKKRNVSRFPKTIIESKFNHALPMLREDNINLKKSKYFRKIYARFGKESNIEAGICWPTKNELNEIINDEKIYDLTLKQKVEIVAKRKQREIDTFNKNFNETSSALKKMPKAIEEYYQRIVKKDKTEEEKQKRKQELVDKAREYYGYDVDPRDARIKTMIEKLEQEKKLEEARLKKEEKKKKLQPNL